MREEGFYEEDEPIAEIQARFEQGEKQLTAAPVQGKTDYLDPVAGWGPILTWETNHQSRELAGI